MVKVGSMTIGSSSSPSSSVPTSADFHPKDSQLLLVGSSDGLITVATFTVHNGNVWFWFVVCFVVGRYFFIFSDCLILIKFVLQLYQAEYQTSKHNFQLPKLRGR